MLLIVYEPRNPSYTDIAGFGPNGLGGFVMISAKSRSLSQNFWGNSVYYVFNKEMMCDLDVCMAHSAGLARWLPGGRYCSTSLVARTLCMSYEDCLSIRNSGAKCPV